MQCASGKHAEKHAARAELDSNPDVGKCGAEMHAACTELDSNSDALALCTDMSMDVLLTRAFLEHRECKRVQIPDVRGSLTHMARGCVKGHVRG